MNHEQQYALREAHANTASDAYFRARPMLQGSVNQRTFEAGFSRGFDAAVQVLRDLSWAPAASADQQPFVTVHVDGSRVHMAWRQPLGSGPTSFDLYRAPLPKPDRVTVTLGVDSEAVRRAVAALGSAA